MPGHSDRTAHYREQAARAREKAATLTDAEARRTMLEVAGLWDQMADLEERTPAGRAGTS